MRRLAFALAAITLIAACTGGDTPSRPGQTSSAPTGGASVAPSASPSLGGFPEGADVLEVAITEPSTLDPMRIQDPGSVLIARQLYEGLTAWDPLAEEVVPAAAEEWKVSRGGQRFTFTLRQGTTFHDGTPVTASDFVYAFERIALKKNAAELAYTLERVEGFADINRGDAKELEGVRATDELTLVIDLTEPFMELPALLTHPGLVPLPKDAVKDEDSFLTAPVGNGPFEMAEPWDPGGPVVLRRFDAFVRTPPLEGIRFYPFPDAAASWLRFVDGEFDVAEVPAGETEPAAETYGDRGFVPFMATSSLGLNISTVRSKKLREAISRAIDRDEIASSVYKGTMLPPRGIVPVGMPGFHENVCGDLCLFDPEAAERLVAELPARQRKVRLDYTEGSPHERVAELIAGNLREAGLEVRLKFHPFARFIKILQDGDQGAYRLGWIAEYPTPDVFLNSLFGKDSPDNHSGFGSGKVDRLLRKARAEDSPPERISLYLKAEEAILASIPIAPIGSFVNHWAAQEHVVGIQFDPLGGFDALGIDLAG